MPMITVRIKYHKVSM